MSKIETYSTSSVTMDASPIVLRENSVTRLVFIPSWVSASDKPLRGGFRFQRKGPKDAWIDIDAKGLSTIKKDEGYELNLDGDDMSKLFGGLEEVKTILDKHGHSYGTRTFILSEKNASGILLQIGDIQNRAWVVEQLKRLESENFENLGSAIGRARLENVIEKFEENIDNLEEKFWQEFFEENQWVLQQMFAFPVIYLNGETYLGSKNSKGRQGKGGTATDFLLMNGSTGSFAVVEVKTPGCNLVSSVYRGVKNSGGKNEVYEIHGDLTGGLVQLENEIFTAVDYFKTQIGDDYEGLNHLSPTGVLLAGNCSKLSPIQKKSFNLFRKSLGKNQIYTFDEMLSKLKLLKEVYEV
jgi:hypothetical protein